MEKLKLSNDQSKSKKEEVSCALAPHRPKKKGMKKPPERQPSESTVSRDRTAHATTAEGTTGDNTGTRTLQQETAILRALGLTEGPKYPVTGEIYRIDFLEFRQHICNKIPLYDGRAVTTFGSFRKPRNYKLVCALHPNCPFFLHGKQQIYADGLAYQDIQSVVNHTCSVQSHANLSLCSSTFLGYLLREEEQLLSAEGSRLRGLDACAQAGEKFGIDFTPHNRLTMFQKVAKARNEQNGASALLAFRSPSPICVTPRPMYNLESFSITGRDHDVETLSNRVETISDHVSYVEWQSELPAAESTSHASSAVVPSTDVAENPQPSKSERKSDQSMSREAKRKPEQQREMEDSNDVARKKRNVLNGHSTLATTQAQPNGKG
jgi:hypothetical protein